jgi:hypothetical protein
MSTQYRLVQSGKTASGGCSAGQGSSEPVMPRIYLFIKFMTKTGEDGNEHNPWGKGNVFFQRFSFQKGSYENTNKLL